MTIILYGGGPGFGLPEISPYCTKTEIQLRLADLPYRKQPARPPESPKGQLPFIEDAGERIADSTFIRQHLERKYGIDLDAGLDPAERAQAWAIERMLENHFGWTVGYFRFLLPENFAKGPSHFFDHAPEEMREQLRSEMLQNVTANMRGIGVLRHCEAEIVELGTRSLAALAALLGDKPYLMGKRPCGVDATAFAMLAGALTPYFDSPLRRRAEGFATLTAYVARLMTEFYPDHHWEGARA
jgi:glutathione S-transferase